MRFLTLTAMIAAFTLLATPILSTAAEAGGKRKASNGQMMRLGGPSSGTAKRTGMMRLGGPRQSAFVSRFEPAIHLDRAGIGNNNN